ncbi:MAG: hypothetical protein J0H06_02995 [Actinobacteria bacterium]|nr:hypothetical protein [Actinomycetota bacterium]
MSSVKTQMATHETSQQEEVLEHMGKTETVIATSDGTVPGIVGPGVVDMRPGDMAEEVGLKARAEVTGS